MVIIVVEFHWKCVSVGLLPAAKYRAAAAAAVRVLPVDVCFGRGAIVWILFTTHFWWCYASLFSRAQSDYYCSSSTTTSSSSNSKRLAPANIHYNKTSFDYVIKGRKCEKRRKSIFFFFFVLFFGTENVVALRYLLSICLENANSVRLYWLRANGIRRVITGMENEPKWNLDSARNGGEGAACQHSHKQQGLRCKAFGALWTHK